MADSAQTAAVLAGYACGRSLACCARPWRALVQPGEGTAIADRLAATADPDVTADAWLHSLQPRPPLHSVAQPAGTCTWLDSADPGCRIQRAAGFAALPVACQQFPRSVVATPAGVEIAWTLACPTAAALVARQPQPWQWQPVAASLYPPQRTVGDRIAVARVADWQFAEVAQLRTAWWQRLADVDQLPQTLAAMATTPLHAGAVGPGPTVLAEPWTTAQVGPVSEALGRLRDTGAEHQGQLRRYWQAWLAPVDAAALTAVLTDHRAALACHAGLALQHAGIHDGGPVGEGIIAAARQTWAAAQVLAALGPAGQHAVRDGLVAAAHWLRN